MIEIERKYDLLDEDYAIISKLNKVSHKDITDCYFDTDDFILFKNKVKYRKRNWEIELKVKIDSWLDNTSKSLELDDNILIKEKLASLWVDINDIKQVLKIETDVEKYDINYKGYNFIVDVQRYKYNNRYEVELLLEDDTLENPDELINEFRNYLWLKSLEQDSKVAKIITCAKNENKELFEVILSTKD